MEVALVGVEGALPVGKAAERPFAYAKRIPARTAPEFPQGAAVKVALVPPKAGKDKPAPKDPAQVEVSFPAAETRDKCRVFEYEVTATLVEDDVDLVQAQRRVMAPDFHLPETAEGKSGTCVFAVSELPLKGRYRFDVRPVECFGHKGAAIHAELAV